METTGTNHLLVTLRGILTLEVCRAYNAADMLGGILLVEVEVLEISKDELTLDASLYFSLHIRRHLDKMMLRG
jgi:hypothetical protein